MRRLILSSAVALIVFAGCGADPKPAVDTKQQKEQTKQVQEVDHIKTETISSENSMVDTSDNGSYTAFDDQTNSEENMQNATLNHEEQVSNIDYSTIYFAFDKFNISSDMQAQISNDVVAASNITQNYKIKLEGNCDEWGSDEYNFALGLKRANAVKKALIAEGINSENISMVSFGESNPSCTEKTQELQ